MINTVIFDFDGVLADVKDVHYQALNIALADIDIKYVINFEDHINLYDGLPTNKKLEILTHQRQLDSRYYKQIWEAKQQYTQKLLDDRLSIDRGLIYIFQKLKQKNIKIFVASNSIKKTLEFSLEKLGLLGLIDGFLSNNDVKNPKPNCEIYLKAIINAGSTPKETLIIEDSPNGIKSAIDSGANVLVVKNRSDVILENIMNKIEEINGNKIQSKLPFNGRILILAAGAGSRFEKVGYTYPKPIIDVLGKPMIQWVVDSLGLECEYIYLFQKAHLDQYNIQQMINLITPKNKIIVVDKLTEGAAVTALLAKNLINDNKPLIIANSDQYIEWESNKFLYLMNNSNVDGGILTFFNSHPKWSYAAINNNGYVTEVAEKNPISNNATVGVYFFKKGSEFIKYAEKMIDKNIRVNKEFYLCPVYNQFIEDGKKIKIFNVDKMEGLGDPESLTLFIQNHKK